VEEEEKQRTTMNHATISSTSVSSSSSSFKAKTTTTTAMKRTAFSAAASSRRVLNCFCPSFGAKTIQTTTTRRRATMSSFPSSRDDAFGGFGRRLTSQIKNHPRNTFTKLSFFKASSSYSSSSSSSRAVIAAAASSAKEATSMTPEEIASQPRWELERHFEYDSPNDGKIDREMDAIETQCKEFKAKYEGKLSAENNLLLEAIEMFEEIDIKLTRALSYVSLASDTRLEDAKMQQRKAQLMQRYGSFQGNFLQWFSLEIANLEEEDVEKQYLLHDGKLKTKYKAFIEEERRSKPYNLSKEVERALTVRSAFAGKRQVVEFYGNELSRLRFPMKDDESGETKEVNMEVLLAKMTSSKDTKTRRECMNILNEGLVKFERTCALSLNMVAGSWHIENTERGFKNLRSQRNVSNNVPDEAVDSLLTAVKTTGVDLCKKYYRLKKGILKETQGLEEFTWADRNATIDIGTGSDSYSWEQAVQICKDGYEKFSPTMAKHFTDMVESKRIDVPAADGKRGGAYCSSSYGCGPFQLLNFTGTQRDVATLAHESGHGVHFILSYQQGILQYHPPLTLAETASIFGEMIVFRDLLERAPSDQDRLQMIMGKCDDIINSVVRQCSFDAFEAKVHEKRQNGQVTPEEMTEAWKECMVDYYGEEGDVYDSYKDTSHLWAYVSHFHNVPFYVYSYAFADLVVGALYGVYAKQPEGFEEKLLDLLSAGGTKGFVEALAPFGLDPASDTFWSDALTAHLGGLLDEAEQLAKKLNYQK
jgi:pepF/M3 family oligoendopeptidase